MTDTAALAARALALRLMAERVKTADATTRAAVAEVFAVGDRKKAWLPNEYGRDVEIGQVRVDAGSVVASVSDEAALLEWCERNASSEVETVTPATVTRVRPAYVQSLLASSKSNGAPITADGEVIPGIDVRTSDPRVVVKAAGTDEAEAALMRALLADAAAVSSLLGEITDGGEEGQTRDE